MEEKGLKIILIGESGVGKTNLINVLFGNEFDENINTTYNSYFFEGKYKLNGKVYHYNIWDTAGQEQYRALNKLFIKESKIVICVYAIDNRQSFEEIDFWVNYVKEILGEKGYILALCANKSDLFETQEVQDEEGKKLAQKYNIKFNVTSALYNIKGFRAFLYELIKDYLGLKDAVIEEIENDNPQSNNTSFKVNRKKFKEEEKKGCCS